MSELENEMTKIISEGHFIKKQIKTRQEAINLFKKLKEPYKIEIIEESNQENDFQIYQQGEIEFLICAEDLTYPT